MSITIRKISITDLATDAVVNAANDGLWAGSGVCGAIFRAAGHDQLQSACEAIGRCQTGSAVITPGFRLKARYIIHAVGPRWVDGKHNEPRLLYSAYYESLRLAKQNSCASIGFPLLSAGIFGYPLDGAWRKAIQACRDFQRKHGELEIIFAVLDDHIIEIGEKTIAQLASSVANTASQASKEENRCFYRVFICNRGDFRDSSKYTFVGDFGTKEFVSQFLSSIFEDEFTPNPDAIIMKIPAHPISVKDGEYDAVIASSGEQLTFNWDEFT